MDRSFDAERRKALTSQLRRYLPGTDSVGSSLLCFEDTLDALGRDGEVDEGHREVEVARIVGSVAWVRDFDRLFRPRHDHLRERWEEVSRRFDSLPPIRLLRLGDMYFVEDGHHRVSVARARGAPIINAYVHRVRTVVCASRGLTVADLPEMHAQRMLFERVPLPDDARIGFRLDCPDNWRRLAEAAEAWGYRQSLDGRPLPGRCDLADAWWKEEVEPLAADLRQRGIVASDNDLEAYLAGADSILD
ncbi:MAG: hypothetical protein OSA99_09755 [Acidimicrobiales bacterium]|nr:hypothetical protein [Acidimicrobiales bacterium]